MVNYESYLNYVRNWATQDPHGSPMSYNTWEQSLQTTEEELEKAIDVYHEFVRLGVKADRLRCQLYQNRAHKNACFEEEYFNELDEKLFKISSFLQMEFARLLNTV